MEKLTCETVQEWIVAELDSSLDDGRRDSLYAHLAHCESCREAERAVRDLWRALVEDTARDPGEAFWQDYRTSLDLKLEGARLGWWRVRHFWKAAWKPAIVFAPALLVLSLVFWNSDGQPPGKPPVDNATCHQLLTELNDVYGPTAEEWYLKAYRDSVASGLPSAKTNTADSALLTWFEVEDEPTAPYL